mgnify:CR=1 FL=1
MKKTTTMSAVAILLTLLLGLSFEGLEAQSASATRSVEIERADLLAQHGRQLAKFRLDFAEASRYLREAAELRGNDPTAVKELVEAGHLAYYGGERLTSMMVLATAGDVAVKTGDAEAAAEAFRDAAWVAAEAGRREVARDYLLRGESLVRSGQVAAADWTSLLEEDGIPVAGS